MTEYSYAECPTRTALSSYKGLLIEQDVIVKKTDTCSEAESKRVCEALVSAAAGRKI